MKKIFLLVLCLTMAAVSFLQAVGAEPTVVMLPRGGWMREDDGWRFLVDENTPLNPELEAIAENTGIHALNGMLPKGARLTPEQIELLYPGAEAYFALPAEPPAEAPALEMFELNGEWYYAEDGVLYYKDQKNGAAMTVDEVFAVLGSDAPAAGKTVYLTIDDAPSLYTMEMLAVLNRLGVKATFFVVGAYVRRDPVFLRAIYEQGHTIANHSYSHRADMQNASADACLQDFQRCEQAVADALGFSLPMPIARIPFGSGAVERIHREALQKSGYLWIDWNALNGDTEPGITSDKMALDRAFTTASRHDGDIVLLVHDGKKRTIRTMPELVAGFRELGYTFRVLEPEMEKVPGVRMGFPTNGE